LAWAKRKYQTDIGSIVVVLQYNRIKAIWPLHVIYCHAEVTYRSRYPRETAYTQKSKLLEL
jgi:hypothetical protein